MAKAIYYNENLKGKELEVLKEYAEDKTVDLGLGKTVAVSRCPLCVEPTAGHATLVAEAKAEAPADAGNGEGGEKVTKKAKA